LSISHIIQCLMIRRVNNELERIWKEEVFAHFTVISRHMLGGEAEENHENFCYDRLFMCRDLNPLIPKHKACVLTALIQ
jgi:hypothetical protein